MTAPFLIGPRVFLRPMLASDVPLFTRWLNHPDVRQHLAIHRPLTELAEQRWLEHVSTDTASVFLVICLREGDRPIGTISLRNLTGNNRVGDLGLQLGEMDLWGQGLGTEAITLALDYGFDTLGLHRVELRCHASNARGVRCYERLGFALEGRQREAHFTQGAFEDVLLYGMLEGEWRIRRAAAKPAPTA